MNVSGVIIFPLEPKKQRSQKKKKRLISGYTDPDKVYDYHTAFDIKPTQVVYNVDINANNKKILNIALIETVTIVLQQLEW